MKKGRWRLLGEMGEGKMKCLLGEIMKFPQIFKRWGRKEIQGGQRGELPLRSGATMLQEKKKRKCCGEKKKNRELPLGSSKEEKRKENSSRPGGLWREEDSRKEKERYERGGENHFPQLKKKKRNKKEKKTRSSLRGAPGTKEGERQRTQSTVRSYNFPFE